MKRFSLLVLLVISALFSSAQWVEQHSGGNGTFSDVFFIDHERGWAVMQMNDDLYGGQYCTWDGGENWEEWGIFADFVANCIWFKDENSGWGGGEGGNYTTDGGDIWNSLSIGYEQRDIIFTDDMHGWLCSPYGLQKTVDGGENWESVYSADIHKVFFTDPLTGWALHDVDWAGIQLEKTINGGSDWEVMLPGTDCVGGMFFLDDMTGWVVGCDYWGELGRIYKTEDGGDNWEEQSYDETNILMDVCFVDEMTGWAVGEGGMITHTTDGGDTWIMLESGTTANLHRVFFLDAGHGWITGDDLTILYYDGTVGLDQPAEANSNSLAVHQFPNPVSASATIEYTLDVPAKVSLSIFNHLGQPIETLVNQQQVRGQHQVTWNTTGYPTGIYFYRLQAGEKSTTGKLVVVR